MKKWWTSRKPYSRPPAAGQRSASDAGTAGATSGQADLKSRLEHIFRSCDDLTIQPLHLGEHRCYLVYLGVMVSDGALSGVEQGLHGVLSGLEETYGPEDMLSSIRERFSLSRVIEFSQIDYIVNSILSGNSCLIVDSLQSVVLFGTASSEGRSIEEPVTDQVVRGPREGFVENIYSNLMLIRRIIKNPNLKVHTMILGNQTQTMISVVYLDGVANEQIVEEVISRISRIQIDGILESNYVQQLIQDAPYSPFPTIFNSERPDHACSCLLEGKVAILTDGTPFVLTAPAVFVEFLHASEDYYDGSVAASIIRWIRALGLLIASFLPAFYVGITTIHQDLLQTSLLIRIAGYREDLPYPVLVEALFMLLTFELVREAGLRMPKAIGNAVTIVGTLVIGQAAVQAGLVGALMVIVVAVTALTTFILPNYNFMLVIRYSSFPMVILSGMFGFMGIIAGLMAILAHLCSLRSFGIPYLAPVAPARREGWKDVFYRAPWRSMQQQNPTVESKVRERFPVAAGSHASENSGSGEAE